jgi:hypothetical protein
VLEPGSGVRRCDSMQQNEHEQIGSMVRSTGAQGN